MTRKNWIWILLACLLLGAAVIAVSLMEDEAEITHTDKAQYLPKVSVIEATPQTLDGKLRTLAEIQPRWSATLTAQVNGEILSIAPHALAGEQVKKGDSLIQLEASAYEAQQADAERLLSEARLVFLQEEQKAKQAKRDWQRSGLASKPSALALNQPQVELARKAVAAAKANVQAAKVNQTYTRIHAPFSGIVTERLISLGQTVNAGDPLLRLQNQTELDLELSLSQRQWQHLSNNWQGQAALLKNSRNDTIGSATIKRGGGFLDPTTRQYKLFLEVNTQDSPQVLAGDFVQVELAGKKVPNSLLVPENAVTREGYLWYLDAENRLRFFPTEVRFFQDNKLVVSAPPNAQRAPLRIVTTPLASFVAGKTVEPTAGEH